MTYEQALSYIGTVSARGSKPGLERITALMNGLGNVQDKLKFVHIAGTNGKGSTSCMLSSILQQAGYKTGLFISPFIIRFNERMQINGRHIPDDTLTEIVERVSVVADAMEDAPTEFELITAAAFVWFAEENCDIVVLETGLGGRLDATNIIKKNECAVITNIGLDHTDYLGNTVEEISYEKACIIKEGCPVVCYPGQWEAKEVIGKYAFTHFDTPCRYFQPVFETIESLSADFTGQRFKLSYAPEEYRINLLGAHQLRNAALVLETVKVLRIQGWEIPEAAVTDGLAAAKWPARFELLCEDPVVFVDGAHNMQGVESLQKAVQDYLPERRVVCLTGVLADKDWQEMMGVLRSFAAEFVTVTPDSPRALTNTALAEYLQEQGCMAKAAENVHEGMDLALARAKVSDSVVVACGSLYMASEIREYFH